jgi:hypothetical protein
MTDSFSSSLVRHKRQLADRDYENSCIEDEFSDQDEDQEEEEEELDEEDEELEIEDKENLDMFPFSDR